MGHLQREPPEKSLREQREQKSSGRHGAEVAGLALVAVPLPGCCVACVGPRPDLIHTAWRRVALHPPSRDQQLVCLPAKLAVWSNGACRCVGWLAGGHLPSFSPVPCLASLPCGPQQVSARTVRLYPSQEKLLPSSHTAPPLAYDPPRPDHHCRCSTSPSRHQRCGARKPRLLQPRH